MTAICLVVAVMLVATVIPGTAQAAPMTFTVNSTNDPGSGTCDPAECTLREAILAANTNAGEDTINFNIPGVVHTIRPLTNLPLVTEAVVIDGTTDPDVARIELDGTLVVSEGVGIVITGGDSTIKGLVVNRFTLDGIRLQTEGGNLVQGNYIGTDSTGTLDLGNSFDGILVESRDNTIGGTTAAASNVISGNNRNGIFFNSSAATGNTIQGNYIGTDVTGTLDLGNSNVGLTITAPNNTIGGTTTGARNLISGNGNTGVWITGASASGNTIQGNYIGTDVTGTLDLGNALVGVQVQGPNTTIGGTTTSARNLISGNASVGVFIVLASATGNTVQGNYIGTDVTGTLDLGNTLPGVQVQGGATNNTIGGMTAGARNLISGNDRAGLVLFSAPGNTVQGNYIGTDVTGTQDLGNRDDGISIQGGPSNTIGGTTSGARNVISGNGGRGVVITGASASGNTIQGNYIGTDVTGTLDLGNSNVGLTITAPNNTIGGTAGARNLISGNDNTGVFIQGASASGNTIQGNYIGTDVTGTLDLGNSTVGLTITAPNNTIGGTTTSARNLISGNDSVGVFIAGASASGNTIQGNYIGTDVTGTQDLGNRGDGIQISGGPSNTIGGTLSGAANVIAFNDQRGVRVVSGTRNGVLGNSIFSNAALGIDLGLVGPTPNDPQDPDIGANDLQNFPVITEVSSGGGGTTIKATLNSKPNTTYSIELFSSPACDPSGFGEGKTFLDRSSVTTDSGGNATLTRTVGTVSDDHGVTATATDPSNNTSEFSACVKPAKKPATLTLSPKVDSNPVGTQHTVTATVKDDAGQPVGGITVRFSVSGSVTTSGSCTTTAAGTCTFTYTGAQLPGADVITAFADTNGNGDQDGGEPGDTAAKTWIAAAPATLALSPATDTNQAGDEHCVTATVTDAFGNPVPAITVYFDVTGANSASGSDETDTAGQATFCYTGTVAGEDVITAFADTNGNGDQDLGEPAGGATKTWTPGEPAILNLEPAADTNTVGEQHCVTATLTDIFGNPIQGETIEFSVPTAVATFATPPSGSDETDTAGQATFCYSAALPGEDVIHAYADTDDDNTQDPGEPFGDATKTWTPPASTELCEVKLTEGGWIIAINADQASFSGNVKVDADGNVQGQQQYTDHGPAQPRDVHSVELLATTCSEDLTTASIFGTATIDGAGIFIFRIDVTDQGAPGSDDTYGIMMSDGYLSGQRQLQGGNVQIHKS